MIDAMEGQMNRYGHPLDFIAAALTLAGVLLFAFALDSRLVLVWCAVATGLVVMAGIIVLSRWLKSPAREHTSARRWVAAHRH